MPMFEAPFRQVHMDFHTSGDIEAVGSQFDPDEFAVTLDRSRVNSVCCFARCHHGWLYYDSKKFPERVHPHLANRHLLKEQIEACHRRGIRVPIYITVRWDEQTTRAHPEWLCVNPQGGIWGTPPYEPGFYQQLCINTPYRDFVKAVTNEVFDLMPAVDGVFFDIVGIEDCSCVRCRRGMEERGLDSACRDDRLAYAYDVVVDFIDDMSRTVRSRSKDAGIYYNDASLAPYCHRTLSGVTHLEFDALPGGGPRGYESLPLRGRFERTLGVDCVAQTGKFHTSWGDFHSFKNLPALQYECFRALSLNCMCDVGDQLLPSGRIEKEVYDLVGKVYADVERKEPWCRGAKAVVDIGLVSVDGRSMKGAMNVLQEGAHQFDVIDDASDLTPYKVLILPDRVRLNEAFASAIDAFVAAGGKLLMTFESGLGPDGRDFLLGSAPVTVAGDGPIHTDGKPVRGREIGSSGYADYVVPAGPIGRGLPQTEHVMYTKGVEVAAGLGAEVLVSVTEPVFHRTWRRFCSHRQAPSSGKASYPAVVRKDGVIYFGHAVFDLYAGYAPLWVKKMVLNALDLILPEPVLRHSGPSTLEATVNEQIVPGRWVVHLLHYIPLGRAEHVSVVEEAIPVYDVAVSVSVPRPVRSVRLVPEGGDLAFGKRDGRVEFVLPKLNGHQMIEVTFKDFSAG